MLARAKEATPILNRCDFSYVFGHYPHGILLDSSGLLKSLELIALPDSYVQIIAMHHQEPYIAQVLLEQYPSSEALYADIRFLDIAKVSQEKNTLSMPSKQEILRFMEMLIGVPYVWGGNYYRGTTKLLELYPPKRKLTHLEESNWSLKGMDCSGLLYEATHGLVPRNTSELALFGKGLEIENKTAEEITALLEPLDMIVWKSHVVFILDSKTTIESRAQRGGVVTTDLLKRLKQIESEEDKMPMNSPLNPNYKARGYVIRRWI